MLDPLHGVSLHFPGNLWSQDQARLFWTADWTFDGVWSQLVGGSAFVDTGVFSEAVQDVQNDNSEVVEGPEPVTSWQRFAVFEPFDLEENFNLNYVFVRVLVYCLKEVLYM